VTERSGRLSTMLWLRGIVFSVLIPGFVAVWMPQRLLGSKALQGGPWTAGWLLVDGGTAVYLWCLLSFLAAHGTPAIFFTRPLRALLGEEPQALVRGGLYRYSRNPMYVGMLGIVFGQAILYASRSVAVYGVSLAACFHLVVTLIEEPHLRRRDAESFARYRREVPRWIGLPGRIRT